MSPQDLGVVLVVGAAIAYLVWKWFYASRSPRPRKGPDVPVRRLVRKRRR